MNNRKNALILAAIMVVLIAGAGVLYNALSARVTPVETVEETQEDNRVAAPDFTALDREGNPVRLSDFLGTPVVLNFWASWCPPCKQEMPHFDTAATEYADRVAFVMLDMVDVDGGRETMEKGMAYVDEQGFTFPVYFDTEQEASYLYGVSSIPATLFIDEEGYVVTGAVGMISEVSLRKGIAILTGEE